VRGRFLAKLTGLPSGVNKYAGMALHFCYGHARSFILNNMARTRHRKSLFGEGLRRICAVAAASTAAEMAEILAANPFAAGAPNRTMTIFLDDPPPPAALDASSGKHDEEMALGRREIYIHYPNGMGRSKLHIPAARSGTARNMNTVAMLAEMCGG